MMHAHTRTHTFKTQLLQLTLKKSAANYLPMRMLCNMKYDTQGS